MPFLAYSRWPDDAVCKRRPWELLQICSSGHVLEYKCLRRAFWVPPFFFFFDHFFTKGIVVFDLPTHPKGYFGPTNPPQAPPTGFQRYLSTSDGPAPGEEIGRKALDRHREMVENAQKSPFCKPCKMVVFEYQRQQTTSSLYNVKGRGREVIH